jgi:hypothetical protein
MTTHEQIRQIFLRPQRGYGLDEAALLLGYSDEELLAAVAHGDIATEATGDIPRVPWEEVALAAAERWSQEIIETSLGEELTSVVPELVRLADLQVRVPRYGIIALGRIAQRDGTTVSEVVARQLLDLVVAESDMLERSVTGLSAATRWPLP